MPIEPSRKEFLTKLFDEFEGLQGRKNIAQGALGSRYKDAAERQNIHLSAAKLAMKLSKQDVSTRRAFKDSFDEYCEALGVFAQGELFAAQPAAAPKVKPEAAPKTPTAPKAALSVVPPPAPRTETAPIDLDPRDQGKRAALAGIPRTQNPHKGADASVWDAGWGEGEQQAVDAAAAANPKNRRLPVAADAVAP
jgi:hypothetical protein